MFFTGFILGYLFKEMSGKTGTSSSISREERLQAMYDDWFDRVENGALRKYFNAHGYDSRYDAAAISWLDYYDQPEKEWKRTIAPNRKEILELMKEGVESLSDVKVRREVLKRIRNIEKDL